MWQFRHRLPAESSRWWRVLGDPRRVFPMTLQAGAVAVLPRCHLLVGLTLVPSNDTRRTTARPGCSTSRPAGR